MREETRWMLAIGLESDHQTKSVQVLLDLCSGSFPNILEDPSRMAIPQSL